ncbi:MAG: precorrin-6A synthase (deacetylating) [Tabrizicola sp.]|uniref:precorrin-6A synthase (deacetylating) n=1 Tax=Tabrizicola sp. TaxID=2005166 RepID=UPI002733A8FE|nr:precorrin-6A synthase (deacetylating) [Tabrizicola sp.]MDP3262633.1 precorrin-6A synthase (deacetylating) [Tabrizicola sp.]MDP3647793.1 precorrin-6A synthase (deacetylating) [Paracoccaceae bacterium]MDZ4065563.1 precorrin-6A synthase (deacetylating) [Tabrizicola sp.]
MTTLSLIGIGTGNPDHLTAQAVKALNRADLILLPRKGDDKSDLADLRRQIVGAVVTAPVTVAEYDVPKRADQTDYLGAVNDWHDAIAAVWQAAIDAHLPKGGRVALMVWGDPSLYDSTLRIAARLPGLTTEVIPGITSLQVLTAAHAIPLNALAAPVVITTGRRLRDEGWPPAANSVGVMLDSGGAFQAVDPHGVTIWWGAYVGMPQQALIHGPLAEVAAQIVETRARLRAEHGWIMDIYLMRRGDER